MSAFCYRFNHKKADPSGTHGKARKIRTPAPTLDRLVSVNRKILQGCPPRSNSFTTNSRGQIINEQQTDNHVPLQSKPIPLHPNDNLTTDFEQEGRRAHVANKMFAVRLRQHNDDRQLIEKMSTE
jgi:hypothetical protein